MEDCDSSDGHLYVPLDEKRRGSQRLESGNDGHPNEIHHGYSRIFLFPPAGGLCGG